MASRSPIRTRSSEESPAQLSWWAALLALIVVLTCVFSGLAALGLTGPDEPRYMDVARTMLRSGDWVTPRLYGQPWFEKPALIYWAAATSFRLFGITDFAARLPGAFAALFAIVVAAWGALRSYGLDAAWLTLLLMPTTVASIGLGRAASPDMLFSSLLMAAAVAAVEMLSTARPGTLSRLAFGGFVGAATLAKGPAATVLAGGAAFLWALASRQWRAVFRLIHPVCVAAFFAVATPWYVLSALRNPDFLRVFILEHNVSRYLTNVFEHPEPAWFFVAVLLAAIAPWTFLVFPLAGRAVANLRQGQEWRNSPALFYGCWTVFPVVFFSFSKSKLPAYVLPAVPPLILLVASALPSLLRERSSAARWWIALAASMLPIPFVFSIFWIRHFPMVLGLTGSRLPGVLAVGAIVGSLTCIAAALAGRLRFALALEAAMVTTLLVATNSFILPKLDPFLSARQAARTTPREALESGHFATLGLSRSWRYGLDFYLDRELPEWNPSAGTDSWVWTTEQAAGTLQAKTKVSPIKRISAEAWLLRIDANPESVTHAESAATAKRD